jgi:hypothetical protein
MQRYSGVLDRAMAIPDSDAESEEHEDEIDDFLLEMPSNGNTSALVAIVDEDANPKEGNEEDSSSTLPTTVLHSLLRRSETSVRLRSTFLQCHINSSSVSKLLLAALHGNEKVRKEATRLDGDRRAQDLQCWNLCVDTFAKILHIRVQDMYDRDPTDRELVDYPFPYAGLKSEYTLETLAGEVAACRSFLVSLWGNTRRYDGSAYFYRYGNTKEPEEQTPWAFATSSSWMLILPKVVVAALTSTALASADRDDAATKYWISIPTWYDNEWHDYHTLLEEQKQGKGNGNIEETNQGKAVENVEETIQGKAMEL